MVILPKKVTVLWEKVISASTMEDMEIMEDTREGNQ
jgi:hypothetical protein